MQHTQNYQLSRWEKDDRIMMEDFNADNARIDAALAAKAASSQTVKTLPARAAGRLRQATTPPQALQKQPPATMTPSTASCTALPVAQASPAEQAAALMKMLTAGPLRRNPSLALARPSRAAHLSGLRKARKHLQVT